jgi:hypothetical protein
VRTLALVALILAGSLASMPARAQESQASRTRPTSQPGSSASAQRPGQGAAAPHRNVSRGPASAATASGPSAPRAGQPRAGVRPVSHIVDHGTAVHAAPYEFVEDMGHGGCSSCSGGGCNSCGDSAFGSAIYGGLCGSCNSPSRFCICFPAHGWVHAEYLLWYQSGMRIPALASTSANGTPRANAGVLGVPTTSVLYGNDEILDDSSSGFRIRFGWWLPSFPGWGIEGEYAGLGEQTESFFRNSTGTPIISRPFFNVTRGREDAELVAFPSVVSGSLAIDTVNRFEGAAVRLRKQLCCSDGCDFSAIRCTTVPTSWRLDGTIGYRYWQLGESLATREQLTSLVANEPGTFDIRDRFETRNQFNGAEVGLLWQGRRGWWSMDALMRMAIGNVHQTATISGSSVITEGAAPGTTTTHQTGFLAQSSNIGNYSRDTFTIIPELGVALGYQLTKRLRVTTGYSLIYWGNVIRPGDQIDLNINPQLFAPQQTAATSPNRPQFRFDETDYWVQGLSFGGEFRW